MEQGRQKEAEFNKMRGAVGLLSHSGEQAILNGVIAQAGY
tara:strand:+ start:449 stop:568 length:120 start_codon:yes stop_codon:yes gene_type:complete